MGKYLWPNWPHAGMFLLCIVRGGTCYRPFGRFRDRKLLRAIVGPISRSGEAEHVYISAALISIHARCVSAGIKDGAPPLAVYEYGAGQ